ncbi:putative short-chain dehydrogenase/reductase [Annulohypoxylon maeteangense]|uniref:putative short-chain dehydrogenase/reductase n=1 Tax=Annulohypoxylon maeteangense TaxID=1927788 RepID=UPI002008DAF7|nr:putative short-chain dehydrogenase/reductase [Annulohypoxylon maeteangense]KAI0890142.1 putative short-chain dehydrogenase/reductase [Annulohypoxylon maeteangense]
MPPRSVLITGCSEGGIGAALAAEFQAQGCQVFATARTTDKMHALAKLGIQTLELDVTSDASIAAAVSAVQEATDGSLDFLINNAGVNHVMPFTDSKVADLRRVIDTNVVAVLAVTHAFLPLLIKAKGTVATVGSINEVFNPPFQVAYNASKAAVHAIARTLRVELAPLGVRFVTLVTGGVSTRLFENSPTQLPEGSVYEPVRRTLEGREFLSGARFVEADVYAREVVGDLLRARPRLDVWRGGMVTVAWILSWFGWEGMLDSSMVKGFHLDQVGR